MMKMLIELNANKIEEEGKYDLNRINAYLDKMFTKRNMQKDNDNWYINGDFSGCGSLIITLSQKEWFMDNLVKWLWYDTDDESMEDLKAHYSNILFKRASQKSLWSNCPLYVKKRVCT